MIIPSIDLMNGQAVQLRQGAVKVLDAGDPRPLATKFGVVGEIAVVDLDAALGKGSNEPVIRDLIKLAPCRVGGGIRDAATAVKWLDAGAAKVVLGTRAVPEVLEKLPRDRVIAALDAKHGEVVIEGWLQGTGRRVIDRMQELRPYVGGFLVTFVEIEGTMTGLDPARAGPLLDCAGDCKLTLAGGVKSAAEIAELDKLGVDAQVGMGLYTGAFDLAGSVAACLATDRPDALWPTVVVDEAGVALGLAYSNAESLKAAIDQRRGVYYSRSRKALWTKGDTSGATQDLIRVDADCDRDTLRFTVRQHGPGFCHKNTRTCWGPEAAGELHALARRLAAPAADRDPASYTTRLLNDPALLGAKLREEAAELVGALTGPEITHEAADVLYFTLVRLAAAGIDLGDVERELTRRSLKVSRRPGGPKPPVEPR